MFALQPVYKCFVLTSVSGLELFLRPGYLVSVLSFLKHRVLIAQMFSETGCV